MVRVWLVRRVRVARGILTEWKWAEAVECAIGDGNW